MYYGPTRRAYCLDEYHNTKEHRHKKKTGTLWSTYVRNPFCKTQITKEHFLNVGTPDMVSISKNARAKLARLPLVVKLEGRGGGIGNSLEKNKIPLYSWRNRAHAIFGSWIRLSRALKAIRQKLGGIWTNWRKNASYSKARE